MVWKVPRPPALNVAQSPAMVMNTYSMRAKFQYNPEYEQVTRDDGQPEYLCVIVVGPDDRLVGRARGSNMKTAKQRACVELLVNAALAWNEENPEDVIDMEQMTPSSAEGSSAKKAKAAAEEITEEFKVYVAAWVDKVALDEIHEARFPDDIDKCQRKYVHAFVEGLENPAVLSKSASLNGRRRLSVMRRAMMEGLAFMSGDNVVVVDMPGPPTVPADIADLASITSEPPERKAAPKKKADGEDRRETGKESG